MGAQLSRISQSIATLENNLVDVAQVGEWADKMGYENTRKFSRRFLRHYAIRPCRVLELTRLKSIYEHLQKSGYSNFEIARRHSMPDEKALNKFVKYHLNCSPTELRRMTEEQFNGNVEKFGSKIR